MADLLDLLTEAGQTAAKKKGYQVWLKTNLGPAIKVYDASEPSADTGGDGLLKYGVYIVDKDGDEKMSFGGRPATNKILMGSIAAIVGTVGVLLIRGLVRK